MDSDSIRFLSPKATNKHLPKCRLLKKLFGILIAFLILPLITTGVYAAKNLQRSETVLVPKGEVVEGDYFAAGERVTIAGTVNGDAYVAGGNVVVEGEINGDLIRAGGTVNGRGKVEIG